MMNIDIAPISGCNNPDAYGMICVKCNRCGRFNRVCINCGKDAFPSGWGTIQFYDAWCSVCESCKDKFSEEELRPHLQAVIPCRSEDFERRR